MNQRGGDTLARNEQVKKIIEALRNEKASPDILPFQDVARSLRDRIQVAEAGIEALQSSEVNLREIGRKFPMFS